jgi:hypothetical protein
MKRIVLILMAIMIAKFAGAQLWNANLNSFTGTATPKLGTSSNHSINFFTNNILAMKIDSLGLIRVPGWTNSGIVTVTGGGLLHPIPAGGSNQVLYGNATWGNLPSSVSSFNTNASGNVYVNPGLKFGIGTTTPITELDVLGDGKVDYSFGVGQKLYLGHNNPNDYGIITYYPATSNNPAVMSFGAGGPVHGGNTTSWGGGGNYSPDPPAVPWPCANGETTPPNIANLMQEWLCVQKKVPNTNTNLGNINIGHDGINAFIESEGTNPAYPNAGDLMINQKCNRNVYVFKQQIPFMPGVNNIMGISGRLHLTGQMQLGVGNVSSFLEPLYQLYMLANSVPGGIKIRHGSSAAEDGLKLIEMSDIAKGISIHRGTGSTDGPERFSIRGDGQTLISSTNYDAFMVADGTTNHVNVRINSDGKTYVNNSAGIGVIPTANTMLDIYASSSSGATAILNVGSSAKPNALNINTNGVAIFDAIGSTGSVFRVRNQGYDLFALRYDGVAFAREVVVTLLAFPDYVFAKDYKLLSLDEVKNFVKENRRLPNMPSAKQIEKDGASIGEIQRLTVEKVEELYLYIFQLEEKIEELNKQIKNGK